MEFQLKLPPPLLPTNLPTNIPTNPVKVSYCEDANGKCKKSQTRDVSGILSTMCECCLPVLGQKVETFDCFSDGIQDITIDYIKTCICEECSEQSMEEVEDKRVALRKRAAEKYLP